MPTSRDIYKRGRLTARPVQESIKQDFLTSVQPLGLDKKRDGFLYIPYTYHPARPAALAVMLHGSGGDAWQGLSLIKDYADKNSIILLAPFSRDYTWDIIADYTFNRDVLFIDQALAFVFARYHVDPSRIAIGGFSDGASYALCLGLSNGNLFTHVIAFSPGFVYTKETAGKPRIFISHGTNDPVLPIKPCSEKIMKQLHHDGFQPDFLKFEGGHEIPLNVSQAAIDWFLK